MGLLDEAIREHLELKRRSGADPGAIAREEQEALAPVLDGDGDDGRDDRAQDDLDVVATAAPVSATPVAEHIPSNDHLAAFSTLGQETAEIDMQAILDQDPDAADGASPVGPIVDGPTSAPYMGEAPGDVDGVDWDLATGSEHDAAPVDGPGQARLTFE
jgi:hypothetical protein